MKIDILTTFPGYFECALGEGLLKIAQDKGVLDVNIVDIRDFTHDRHRSTDDYPYGGGAGMVMKPEPIAEALDSVPNGPEAKKLLLTPRGRKFDQELASGLSGEGHVVLLCGHYEGVDERIRSLVDDEISIGDYVLSGGEPAALVVMDAVARLLEGVLGGAGSLDEESFSGGLLEYPQYTRPPEFRGMNVPDVLLGGNHAKIARWRRYEAIRSTFHTRPDLLKNIELSPNEKRFVEELETETAEGVGTHDEG